MIHASHVCRKEVEVPVIKHVDTEEVVHVEKKVEARLYGHHGWFHSISCGRISCILWQSWLDGLTGASQSFLDVPICFLGGKSVADLEPQVPWSLQTCDQMNLPSRSLPSLRYHCHGTSVSASDSTPCSRYLK